MNLVIGTTPYDGPVGYHICSRKDICNSHRGHKLVVNKISHKAVESSMGPRL